MRTDRTKPLACARGSRTGVLSAYWRYFGMTFLLETMRLGLTNL
ncbi:hypothetical protein MNBD_PLANCTO03-1557, partial [hydrothermal vent metagenome]